VPVARDLVDTAAVGRTARAGISGISIHAVAARQNDWIVVCLCVRDRYRMAETKGSVTPAGFPGE
jgi:methyl coenzyme M reductase gamma subunit